MSAIIAAHIRTRIRKYARGRGNWIPSQGHASKEAIVMNEAVSRPIALQDEEAEQEKNKQTNNTTSYNWHNKNVIIITHLHDTYCVELVQSPLLKLIA